MEQYHWNGGCDTKNERRRWEMSQKEQMENYLRWECGTDFVKKNMEVFLKCKDMLEELFLDQSEICVFCNP